MSSSSSADNESAEEEYPGSEYDLAEQEQGPAARAERVLDCIVVADSSPPDDQFRRMFDEAFWEEGIRHGRVIGQQSQGGLTRVPAIIYFTSDQKLLVRFTDRRSGVESIPNGCVIDPERCEIEQLRPDQHTFRITSRSGKFAKMMGNCQVIDFETVEDATVPDKYHRLLQNLDEEELPCSAAVRGNATFYRAHRSDTASRVRDLNNAHTARLELRAEPLDPIRLLQESERQEARTARRVTDNETWGVDGLSAHNGTTLSDFIESTSSASVA